MRRFSSSRGVAALEGNEPAEVSEDTAAVAVASDEASKAEVETDASEVEGGDIVADMDEGAETAEALESMAYALGVAAKNGGIDKHSAAVISIATEHMCARVGMRRKPMPSMESFGGASSRIGATQLAMEGIKQSAKDLWKYIVEAFKKLVSWAKGHWQKVFGGAEKMKKRAIAIAAAVDGIRTKKAALKTFDDEATVKALYLSGSVDSLSTGLEAVLTKTTDILDTNATNRINEGDSIVEAVQDSTAEKVKAIKITTPSGTDVDETTPLGKQLGTVGSDMKWATTGPYPGGIVWAEYGPTKALEGLPAIKAFGTTKANYVADGSKAPTKVAVKTLAANEIEDIAKKVEAIADALISFRKTEAKLNTLLDKVTKAAERMAKNADNDLGDKPADDAQEKTEFDKNSDDKEQGKAIRTATDKIRTFVLGAFVNATGYPLKTGQAALNYCQKSLNQYE